MNTSKAIKYYTVSHLAAVFSYTKHYIILNINIMHTPLFANRTPDMEVDSNNNQCTE